MEKNGRKLWNLLFHYNYFKKEWACFERDDKENYFNGLDPIKKIGRGKTPDLAFKNKIT